MRPRWILGLGALLLVAAAITGVAQPHFAHSAATAPKGTISVSGMGDVQTVPNRGTFSFTVQTQAKTATAALAQNGAAADAVSAALKGAGVAAADIQTQQVSLDQRTSDDGQTVLGYTATNTVSATIKDLDKAGRVVDAAVGAGATGVSGPALTSSDTDSLYRSALAKAVDQAHAKAQALADAANLTLGRVVSITEGGTPTPLPLSPTASAPASGKIEPGTQTIEATVSIVYATQ